ncbi:hypothetical protein SAMN05421881_10167 [Nitrosomonas halophila]|uniref:Uncharacterized protein n=1 Tax=Nitrosomonas halophila TaxID=44576 RepID=A0A1H3GNU4_9PROT|nr:hypothetical protein SAMN05421881_10167 [Nitrosomonas halophila]
MAARAAQTLSFFETRLILHPLMGHHETAGFSGAIISSLVSANERDGKSNVHHQC